MPSTPLTFAAFGSKAEVVDLTALAVLTGDARLALTLASADVTLSVGGTQSMAVTPEMNTGHFSGEKTTTHRTFLKQTSFSPFQHKTYIMYNRKQNVEDY